MYDCVISDRLKKVLVKLFKKDKFTYDIILNKIQEIVSCKGVEHYKNLKKPLHDYKRVHVRGSFVLLFKVDGSKILFTDFDHHDNVYR
jgi:YafQ family addiction module toxin component